MSNVLAGIGRGQLRVLAQRVAARRAVFDRYRDALADVDAIGWMPEAAFGCSTRWLSVCLLDPRRSPVTPDGLIGALARSGIEARRVWKPMHQQPLFKDCKLYSYAAASCFADEAFAQGVCLPSGSNLGHDAQERIVRTVKQVFARAGRRSRAAG
jgi:pyridoxal phosphate-dependent aminotransferase EpsN